MNDLISVDELVHETLSDSEFHGFAGSWSHMQLLLDELMPQHALTETQSV